MYSAAESLCDYQVLLEDEQRLDELRARYRGRKPYHLCRQTSSVTTFNSAGDTNWPVTLPTSPSPCPTVEPVTPSGQDCAALAQALQQSLATAEADA